MTEKRVLSVGVDKDSLGGVSTELERWAYVVEAAPTPRSGLRLLREIPFDMVVLAHPQPDLDLRSFLKDLRWESSQSRKSKLLIVASDPAHAELEGLQERRVEVVSDATVLGEVASQALTGNPRVQLNVIVKLAASLPYGTSQRICQSENLSVSGMLVRANDVLPLGTPTRVEFTLPGAKHSMRLDAKVVRLTGAGEIPGIALSFEAVSERNQELLQDFVASWSS